MQPQTSFAETAHKLITIVNEAEEKNSKQTDPRLKIEIPEWIKRVTKALEELEEKK
jgi:hypothetical protein